MPRGKRRKAAAAPAPAPVPAPVLPSLPTEIWTLVVRAASDTVENCSTVRLLCKGFAKAVYVTQLRLAANRIHEQREDRRKQQSQQDITNGINEDERANRVLLRSIENVGDTRLHVFFSLLVNSLEKKHRVAARVAGLEAMRQMNKWFEPLDVP